MKRWQQLQQARRIRDAKRDLLMARREAEAARNDRRRIEIENDQLRHSVLNNLSKHAADLLQHKAVRALERVRSEFLEDAIEQLDKSVLANAKLTAFQHGWSAPDRFEKTVTFRMVVPEKSYHFVVDEKALKS